MAGRRTFRKHTARSPANKRAHSSAVVFLACAVVFIDVRVNINPSRTRQHIVHCSTFVMKEQIQASARNPVEISERNRDRENQGDIQCWRLDTSSSSRKVGTSVPIPSASYPRRLAIIVSAAMRTSDLNNLLSILCYSGLFVYSVVLYGILQERGPGYRSWYSDSLRAGRSGDRGGLVGAIFSAPVQTGPGVHPDVCAMCTGSPSRA
jgi:hypothetical protein